MSADNVGIFVPQFQFGVGLTIAVTLATLVSLSRLYTGMHSVLVSYSLNLHTHTHAHIVQYKTLKLNMGFIIHCVWLSCLAEALIQDSKFSRHFMLPSFKWEASALMTHAVIFLSRLLRP